MSNLGKRTTKAREGVDREKLYPLTDAVKMVKERAKAKFDETIEVAMNLGVDPRHADQQVREIAEKKMKDLNCDTIESAMKMVEGSARSMGLEVAG